MKTQSFIAMEFLEGTTLKHRVTHRPLEMDCSSLLPSKSPTRSTPLTRKPSFTATSSLPTYS